jgi:hypothetical protein
MPAAIRGEQVAAAASGNDGPMLETSLERLLSR